MSAARRAQVHEIEVIGVALDGGSACRDDRVASVVICHDDNGVDTCSVELDDTPMITWLDDAGEKNSN